MDDQLHTMPMKFSQGLQQAINRGAEVSTDWTTTSTARAGQWRPATGCTAQFHMAADTARGLLAGGFISRASPSRRDERDDSHAQSVAHSLLSSQVRLIIRLGGTKCSHAPIAWNFPRSGIIRQAMWLQRISAALNHRSGACEGPLEQPSQWLQAKV